MESEFGIDKNGDVKTGIFKDDVRILKPAQVGPYLEKLQYRLGKLENVLHDTQFHKFLKRIVYQYHLLEMAYRSQKSGYSKIPFSIDPTDSGMPHFGNFHYLHDDQRKAPQTLKEIGDIEDVLKEASDKIVKLEFPSREQELLQEYEYFSSISATNLLRSLEVGDVVEEEHKHADKDVYYKMEWFGIDARQSGFLLYKMNFTVNSDKAPFKPLEDALFIRALQNNFLQPLDLMFYEYDRIPYIHPKKITRIKIGPYFHNQTLNDPRMQRLFDEHQRSDEEEGFMFHLSRAKIESMGQTTRHRKFWDRIKYEIIQGNRNIQEVQSDVRNAHYWMTNFRIKQILSGNTQYGDYGSPFGLTKQGDVIE